MSTISEKTVQPLKSNAFRYALFGMVFGLPFPMIATIIKIFHSQLPLNAVNFMLIQRTDPVLWIVDTAPLVLGLFAAFAGRRQDVLQQVNDELTLREKELTALQASMEENIRERTHELSQISKQMQMKATRLQTIADISREILSIIETNPRELPALTTRIISEKLGYYHVGIFLLDENREYALLRAANSKGGQQMLARRHQLKIGGAGIVGYVAQSGRPRIALDTGADAVFFNNPDLPETRSEMAVPLKYGDTVIGVLDVQSNLPSAFNNEDASTFSTLANQVAIILLNLQNLDDSKPGMALKKASGRGMKLSRKEEHSGYSFNLDGTISSALPKINPALDKALASGETVILAQSPQGIFPSLAVPVKFRDQVVGIIHVEASEPNRKWSDDEVAMLQAISERAAFALENARLFEGATRRAEQEETIARVTTQIGSSTDFNRILQTTIRELGQALGASRSFIQLGIPSENERDKINE